MRGIFNLLKKRKYVSLSSEERAHRFWNWFINNKELYEEYLTSDSQDPNLTKQLSEQVKKFNFFLFLEIGINEDGQFILIITPDGNPEGIAPTKELYSYKPNIQNWIIKKFRQPYNYLDLEFELDGCRYKNLEIVANYELDKNREKVDLILCVKALEENPMQLKQVALLYLDHILGEFNTLTRVGEISFCNLKEKDKFKQGINLIELRQVIEREFY